jgi:glycosyltransferase involved in cell wall biosynthesis
MMDRFNKRYGLKPGIVLSNARRVSLEVPSISNHAEDIFVVGFISNITQEKGISEYFHVMELLLKVGKDVCGLIAGPIPDRDTEAFVVNKIVQSGGRVRWLGAVYGEQKQEFFSRLSVLVFPSKYDNEAQPNVLFEALQVGVPVVAYGRGCIADDIEGSGSLAIPPGESFTAPAVEYIGNLYEAFATGRTNSIRQVAAAHFSKLSAISTLAEQRLLDELLFE